MADREKARDRATERLAQPMNSQRLLELYDRVADAPDAVERLRKFVLDLAVRGKLVEQNPEDEPASELLERIEAEKARLLKAGEIRKPRAVPSLDTEDISYPAPDGWTWTQIAQIGVISPRNEADDDLDASFVPMPMISAELGIPHQHEVRPWGEIKKGYTHFAEGDVGLAKITPCFENGKSAVFRNLTGGIGAGTTELHIVRPIFVNPDYVLLFLKSPQFIETGIPRMTGTAGQKRVPSEYFTSSPFPLPPLPEQHRIVAKADELMALLDRLESTRTQRETTRDHLTTASLARLTAPETTEKEFRAHARFAINTLPTLTTRPDQIKTLRQTILDLAVRGKLVEQDPADEAVSAALKPIGADGYSSGPFRLPTSWTWVDVASVAQTRLGKMLDKAKNRGVPRPYLRNVNVRWFDFDLSDLLEMPFEDSELSEFSLRHGDVLICEGGEPGRAAVWDERAQGIYFQKAIHRVRFATPVEPRFFLLALKASADDGRLAESFTGTGIKHFTGRGLKAYRFPLPPLAEQHRIVAKVDALIAHCDRLEETLTTANTTHARLLGNLLHETVTMTTDHEIAAVV